MSGSAEDATRPSRLQGLFLCLIAALFLLHVAVATRHAFLDDAFVSFRYARHLVRGQGLVFNAGERVEGYTNFSWVMLSAALLALGLEPPTWMPLIGAASGVGTILMVAGQARSFSRAEGRLHRSSGIVAGGMLAASTSLAFWAGTGLETGLFTLLMTGAGLAMVDERPRAFAIFTGLGFLTRPEAGLLGAIGIVWFVLLPLALRSSRGRLSLEVPALLGLLVGPYLCWKLWYFGRLLPNTLAAKPASFADGASYVGWALLDLAGPLVLGAAASVSSRRSRALLGLFSLHALSVVLEGGDWMPFTRLLLPSLGWLAVAVDATFFSWLRRPKTRADQGRFSLAVLSLLYVPQSLLDLQMISPRGDLERDPSYYRMLAALEARGTRVVATFDIGLIGWAEPGWTIVDLAGLTDPVIAALPGGHYGRRPTAEYLEKRRPDAFVFAVKTEEPLSCHYEVECNVAALPWFSAHYSRATALVASPVYLIVVYVRSLTPRTIAASEQ